MADARRGYDSGSVTTALVLADEALRMAFSAALDAEDYDSQIMKDIRVAQASVRSARRRPIDWNRPAAVVDTSNQTRQNEGT